MPSISRSALVEHSALKMFNLVNDVEHYPERFAWCESVEVRESSMDSKTAKLQLALGGFKTWFETRNTLNPPHDIHMKFVDGPFKSLDGVWTFHALDESACKVSLRLDFEPRIGLLAPAFALGFQALADRMVDDFIRVADDVNLQAETE